MTNEKAVSVNPFAKTETTANKAQFPYFFRILDNYLSFGQKAARIVHQMGWKDVAVLSETEEDSLTYAKQFFNESVALGTRIISVVFFDIDQPLTSNAFEILRGSGARIILLMLTTTARDFFVKAYSEEFTGYPYVYIVEEAWLAFAFDINYKENDTLRDAAEGMLALSTYIPLNTTVYKKLREEVVALYGPINFFAMNLYAYLKDAFSTFALGAQIAKKNTSKKSIRDVTTEELVAAIRTVSFQGLTGLVAFDQNQERTVLDVSLSQFNDTSLQFEQRAIYRQQNDSITLIDLNGDGEAKAEDGEGYIWFGRPGASIPSSTPHRKIDYWSCEDRESSTDIRGIVEFDDEEDEDPDLMDDELYCDGVVDCVNWSDEGWECSPSHSIAALVTGVFVAVFLVFVVGTTGYLLYHRKQGRVKAMGLVWLLFTSLSCFVGSLSVLSWYGRAQTYLCQLRFWLLVVCSALLLGSLATKQYRVWKIFSQKQLNVVIVTEGQLLFMTLLLLIPDLVIMIIWTAVDTVRLKSEEVDGNDHGVCSSDLYLMWILLLIAYKVVWFGVCSVLAFLTRSAPSAYGDSKLIGFAIYNATLILVILIPIILSVASIPFLQWLLTIWTILLFFSTTYLILMVPKLWVMLSDRSGGSGLPSISNSKSNTTKSST